MIGASLFFAVGYLPVRELAGRFNALDLVFYRALLTLLFMLPWLFKAGLPILKTNRLGLHVFRGAITYVGMVCLFYGLANMMLADAAALAARIGVALGQGPAVLLGLTGRSDLPPGFSVV